MNLRQNLALTIIRRSFHLSVWTIEQFCDIAEYERKTRALGHLPEGSLGKEIADCLERNKLRLVPNFESHDLKHALLDFRMTPLDEIRMQAFMLGNGNYSVPSVAIFLFGALLLPSYWTRFYADFQNGRCACPISAWSIEDYAHCDIATLREIVFNYAPVQRLQPAPVQRSTVFGAFAAIIIGILAMLYCLPYLFSSNIADLIGAGFPFLAAAIIASAGLIALSNVTKNRVPPQMATG